ncbi:unnamed protein product [Dracunculus medinensis]|uniref:Uncharacterized protein n=1 Tax=Dracunculus medinensis TaxID=318479 RepID=A0A0N4UNU5_DRAME|nr:unnamed protein product [Dracunculus medinensis]
MNEKEIRNTGTNSNAHWRVDEKCFKQIVIFCIKKTCKMTTGIPFNLPNRWNCEEILQQISRWPR